MKAATVQPKCPSAARDRLIAEHVEIARRISLRMARSCPDWLSREDLVSAALLGLTEAADRYDSSRNEPFIAFAEKRIRGAVLDELRRGDIMPRRARQMARKIGVVIQKLQLAHGDKPSDAAIAGALGVSIEHYKAELEGLTQVIVGSLEPEESSTLRFDGASPEAEASRRELLTRVRAVLPQLDARDLVVLGLYYNDELTYQEIAQVLGVTTSRVCQLHARAIARIRAEVGADEVHAAA